ncbi:hypothetical protein PIB30_089557 [Stylosanthes scabra]|uniref:Uncharacterized protein n=1 Tax=Stylosanthes scabra TaxID=79078 RepID=A0ABU6QTY9_9FABA|nr:hypothetical protein [Stylosanthes scabra]
MRPVKKKFKTKTSTQYYVELPDDTYDQANGYGGTKHNGAINQERMELAVYLESALNLKRKWEDKQHDPNEVKTDKQVEEIETDNKKKKTDIPNNSLAEEAGLIKPHPKP